MPNITISLSENLLNAGRQYAKKHNTSLNNLIRKQLEQTVGSQSLKYRLDECFELMNRAAGNSKGEKWKREDLYDV